VTKEKLTNSSQDKLISHVQKLWSSPLELLVSREFFPPQDHLRRLLLAAAPSLSLGKKQRH